MEITYSGICGINTLKSRLGYHMIIRPRSKFLLFCFSIFKSQNLDKIKVRLHLTKLRLEEVTSCILATCVTFSNMTSLRFALIGILRLTCRSTCHDQA